MKLIILLSSLFISMQAMALPVAPFDAFKTPLRQFNQPNPLFSFQLDNFNYEGIVKLNNCSGALVVFQGQSENSKAYVLTNGHCIGKFIDPGKAIQKRETYRRMYVANAEGEYKSIQAAELSYATMTGTDSALYKLTETYQEIFDRLDVRPFLLSYNYPKQGTQIDILSGYWQRGYSCTIDKFIYQLNEAGWAWKHSIKYSKPGCFTIGGTSGSPIIERGTRVVLGVNNTGNNDGEKCTMNNPCEVDRKGNITVEKDASYGQQTYIFYYCINSKYEIDTTKSACPLTD